MAGSIQYIKIARIDGRGVDITNTLETLNTLVIPSASINLSYTIQNSSRYNDYYLFNVVSSTNTNISTGITSSVQYNIITTPKSSNNVAAVQFTPMPISLGTINSDSLNLIQSATSSIIPGAGGLTYFAPPTDLQEQNGVYIKLQGTASVNGSGGTGLLEFVKGSINDFNAGSGIQVGTNVFMNPNASASLDMEVNTTINFGEVIYLRLREGGNNFNVTNLSFSQDTFLQITSSVHDGSTKSELVLEPFFKSQFKGTDCDVLAGNASQPVSNPFLQDIDYGNGNIIPVNNNAIISGTAARGTVPESYYTALSSINLKYNGSKNESSDINVGQTPSITLNQSLVAYVDFIKNAAPLINGKSIANIKYLINGDGDAISPNLSETTVTDVQNNFEDNKEIDVSLVEPPEGTGMQILNGIKTIIRGGYRVEPILYTQTLSGVANTISMETSSLTPVLDVRSENKDTSGPLYPANMTQFQTYIFNQENNNLPGKNYYDHTTGKYTVASDVADSGVTLNFRTQLKGGVAGYISGQGPTNPGNVTIEIVHDATSNGGGITVLGTNNGGFTPVYFTQDPTIGVLEYAGGTVQSSLVTGNIASGEYAIGDTFYVRIKVNFYVNTLNFDPILLSAEPNASPPAIATTFQFPYFEIGSTPSPTGIDPITGSIWTIDGSSPSSTIKSVNNNLLLSYNLLKQQLTPNSGMDETQQLFTVQTGDQFKFEDDESKIYEVASVVEPSQNVNNELSITFTRIISPAINLDYFLIRRFAPDGSSIIFDELKPGTTPSGPAFIKPRFTTDILDKDIDAFIQDLKSKNLLT